MNTSPVIAKFEVRGPLAQCPTRAANKPPYRNFRSSGRPAQMVFFYPMILRILSNKAKLRISRSSQGTATMKGLCYPLFSRRCSICLAPLDHPTDRRMLAGPTQTYSTFYRDSSLPKQRKPSKTSCLRCTLRMTPRVRHTTRVPRMHLPHNTNALPRSWVIWHSKHHAAFC